MEISSKYIENTFKGRRLKLVDLSDGRLDTEDGFSFPIHRYALADRSKYFFVLFCGMEKDKKEALIPGIKGEVLSDILHYIYTGEIHVTIENISDLIIAADYLSLEDLLSQMKTTLAKNLSIANSLAIFIAALKINSEDIFKESFRFVEMHFEDIMRNRNTEFYELPLEALKRLLSDINLRIRNENVVWLAIVEWVSAYFPNRLPYVPELLFCFRIAEVNEPLAQQILQHDFVAGNASCQRMCGIKCANPEFNNLQILQHYMQNSPNPKLSFYAYRSPLNLQFVARYCASNGEKNTQIYVTYDDKLDFWRKVAEVGSSSGHFLAVNDCIYMFETCEGTLRRFSITEKRWLQSRNFRDPRSDYTAVKFNRLIYILGGYSRERREVFGVEIYDPENDVWYDTAPMPPVFDFGAVTLNESIYVVGNRDSENETMGRDEVTAEVYSPDTEIWNALPRPAVNRSNFALAAYHKKLYVIGGAKLFRDCSLKSWKEVEVFDPANNIWSRAADLPYAYFTPKAVVINDQMIVYENAIREIMSIQQLATLNPSVVWNVRDERWETIGGSFLNADFHMYNFFALEESGYVNVIAKENKNPEIVFERSPFS